MLYFVMHHLLFMKFRCFLLFLLIPLIVTAQNIIQTPKSNLLIGTYTQPGKSEGLYVYEFNSETGDLQYKSKISGVVNPSFLTVSSDQKYVYAVNETGRENPGQISSFIFDPNSGELKLLNQVSSMGDDPCYISIDKQGKHIYAGNYSGGNLAVFKVLENGSLSASQQVISHQGSSINKSRQEKPHVHSTVLSPEGKYLFAADLGTDKIYSYQIKKGNLTPHRVPFVEVAPGSGPRHLTFHPDGKTAYVVYELTGKVGVYRYKAGKLTLLQTVSMLADDFKGKIGAADIHVSPDGRHLYASNRGDANELVIYRVERDGRLSLTGRQSTLGKAPRNFALDPGGKFLLAANQNSDEIVVFRRDITSGQLSDTGKRIAIGQPVCLIFAPL